MTEPQVWVLIGVFSAAIFGMMGIVTSSLNRTLTAAVGGLRDTMNAKFEAFDAKFEAFDAKFEAFDARFRAVEVRFEALSAKLESMDRDIQALSRHVFGADSP